MGYAQAGFEVTGVDVYPQKDYPFKFICSGAIKYAREHGHEYHFIHASPPCLMHTALTKGTNAGRVYADYISQTRDTLLEIGVPFVIENVAGAPIRKDLMLCGEMFDLRVIRERYFELHGVTVSQPVHPPHRGKVAGWRHGEYYDGPYVAVYGDGGGKGSVREWQEAMQIGWTKVRESLANAIPPAYTEYIGRKLIETGELKCLS